MKLIRNNRDKVFWSFLVLWIFASILFIGILNVEFIIVHGIAILIFSILILLQISNEKFYNWLDKEVNSVKYKLTIEETTLWDSIVQKAEQGYKEFCKECEKNDKYWGWPWMSPRLTKEEQLLINKIHEHFYPGDYIVDPIGASQADYAWYKDVKDKVKYEIKQ